MIKELKRMPFFSETDLKVLEHLIQEKQIYKRSYHKGATVHEQNTECYVMDVVYSGKLVAYSLTPNGSESVVFEFETGSIIGANLLFGNQNRYPMNIYCTYDSVLLHISKSGISELLKGYGFVMQFVQSLSMNAQGMNRKIAMYTQKSLRENLMDYFLALSTQQKTNWVVLTVTKKQLADYFGVQRPSLFRELKRMKDEGLIEIANKRIMIKFLNGQG
ncbi:Crp/Fnr family transcriptional regulator [Lacrimispora defluvii]|uniref:Crp/Fnr family transcriptional regulator n=1 Tax=Lacrimispora defluvii TaxID=2719233 RepID=A0ABX1VY05_9FIRM|nr:Crp/Fnr family transcriptional regulator [Lacrimispora defluvii]NNJ32076.1 Crp/Fnr family transcriptional regulator [Lacrimispora defluvii]